MRGVFVLVVVWLAECAAQQCIGSNFNCPSQGCPDNCNDVNFNCFYANPGDALPTCDHKRLSPVNGNDVGLSIVLFVVLALSSAAGIGGGGLIIPLMMIIASFPTYYSVPLSVTSVAGGSIVRFIIQVREHHPVNKQRYLIDMDLVILLLPTILVGTVLGVLLNSVSPTWLVLATICIVLTYVSYETIKKAIAIRKMEKAPPKLDVPVLGQVSTNNNDDDDHNTGDADEPDLSGIPDTPLHGDIAPSLLGSMHGQEGTAPSALSYAAPSMQDHAPAYRPQGTGWAGSGPNASNDNKHGKSSTNESPTMVAAAAAAAPLRGSMSGLHRAYTTSSLPARSGSSPSTLLGSARGTHPLSQKLLAGVTVGESSSDPAGSSPRKAAFAPNPEADASDSDTAPLTGNEIPMRRLRTSTAPARPRPQTTVALHPSVAAEVKQRAASAFFSPFLDTITADTARQLLLLEVEHPDEDMADGNVDETETQQRARAATLAQIYEDERRFPWKKILFTFALLGYVILLSLIRGGEQGTTFAGVNCGSGSWAGVLVVNVIGLLVVSFFTTVWIRAKYSKKLAAGYKFLPGDVHYTLKRSRQLALAIVLAGLVSGYLGIGAGMIVGPFLLYVGLLPTVSSATTSYLTLFTSSSATIQYIALGRVLTDYGILFFIISLGAALAGQYVIVVPIKKRRKTYALVFLLAAIISCAAILLIVTGAIHVKQQADDGSRIGFSPLCDS